MDPSGKSEVVEQVQAPSAEPRALLIGTGDRRIEVSLAQALTGLHCSFAHAAGIADALQQLRQTPYAVVVTDPDTRIHEDLAVVDEISHIRPDARVIILAPDGTPEEIIAALRHKVFLCKVAPFDAGEVARYVVSAIEAGTLCPAGLEVLSADRNWISIRMNCHAVNSDRLVAFFDQLQMTLPERPPEGLMFAFREILNNAIEHGVQNDPSKSIQVSAVRTARSFVFYVADPGTGFRRDAVPHAAILNTPDQPTRHIEIRENLGMRPGGYGILTARGVVDELIYNEIGNEVLLIKYMS
jgi:anti-sigma regulatory factor (Ser/Thr protein kinase)/ActR/RegA family two-component response regulator